MRRRCGRELRRIAAAVQRALFPVAIDIARVHSDAGEESNAIFTAGLDSHASPFRFSEQSSAACGVNTAELVVRGHAGNVGGDEHGEAQPRRDQRCPNEPEEAYGELRRVPVLPGAAADDRI